MSCPRCAELEKRLEALRKELERAKWEATFWHTVASGLERERQTMLDATPALQTCTHYFEGGHCLYCGGSI